MQVTVPPASNGAARYLKDIDAFFYLEEQSGASIINNQHVKPAFFVAAQELNDVSSASWEGMLNEIKNNLGFFRIRSITSDTMTCLKAFLVQDVEDNGICLYLSFLGNYIGYTYVHNEIIKQVETVRPYFLNHPLNKVSYLPPNDKFKTLAEQITEIVCQFFPDFIIFPESYASYPVPAVQTQEGFYMDIDLFQVIFTPNISEFF